MGHQFSLAHLTVMDLTPPEMIHIASRAGYDFVGIRLIPMGVPGEHAYLPEDKEMIRRTKAALDETGIRLLDLELAQIVADRDPKTYVPARETAAELGARHVISSAWTKDRTGQESTGRDFIIERYAEICDLARPFGLTVDLEFPTFSRLTNLQEAADIVRAADRPNGGLLVDTLYIHFSRMKIEDLQAIPREWFHFMHISDTRKDIPDTQEDIVRIAREERLYPGEGCIDFKAILSRVPAIPYALELPNAERVKELGYEGHARRCLEMAKRCFADPIHREAPAHST